MPKEYISYMKRSHLNIVNVAKLFQQEEPDFIGINWNIYIKIYFGAFKSLKAHDIERLILNAISASSIEKPLDKAEH